MSSDTDSSGPVPQDARLTDLIEAAEAGDTCPRVISLLTGSWLIQGRPISTEKFLERTHDALYRSFAGQREVRKFRGDPEQRTEMILRMSNPIVASIDRSDEKDVTTLNLADVTITSSVGPSLHPPVVRVSTASISAWWINDFEVKNPKGDSSFALGFSF